MALEKAQSILINKGSSPRLSIQGISAELLAKINGYLIAVSGAGLLLDLYPNAAGAYSLRKLKTGVTNVVRVRRSSDDAEQDFTPTEITDGTLANWVGQGNEGFLTQFNSQKNSINVGTGIVTRQPTIVDSSGVINLGSKPAFSVQKDCTLEGAFNQTISSGFMIFCVVEITTTGNKRFLSIGTGNDYGVGSGVAFTGTQTIVNGVEVGDPQKPLNQQMLVQLISEPSGYTYYQINNDAIVESNTVPNFSLTPSLIGLLDEIVIDRAFFRGKYQEALIYNYHNAADLAGIKANINAHYNIYPDGGLLFDYPNSKGAYSLRQLKTYNNGYEYPVVRVRRGSDDAEQDFTAAQITDGTLTTFTGAGDGFVSVMYDQSGNGLDATQNTLTAQPQIVEAGTMYTRSGRPCVRVTGTQWFAKATTTTVGFTSASTFAVAAINENNGTSRFLYGDSATTSNEWQCFKGNIDWGVRFAAQSNAVNYPGKFPTNLDISKAFLIDAQFDGSQTNNTINDMLSTGIEGGTFNSSSSALLAKASSGLQPWFGDFLELIHFTSDETSNRAGIASNINAHYNLY